MSLTLPHVGADAQITALMDMLLHGDVGAMQFARKTLLGCGTSILPFVYAALPHAHTQRDTWRLLHLVTEFRDVTAVPVMIHALDSESRAVRVLAAEYLGDMRDPRAFAPLAARLNDAHSDESKVWVINALGQFGDRRAVPLLIAFLEQTECAVDRYAAIDALERLGDPAALPHICRYADDPDHHVRAHVRKAIDALERQRG
ncbi:MAG: HEAT repeat domain-containing protein [bacterium]|nr:HEAT repeat domain-containing protein [bacterium]